MNRFRAWLFDFMRGRYGYDEYNRYLTVVVIVMFIVAIVLGVVASIVYGIGRQFAVGRVLNLLSTLANWAAVILLVWTFARSFSRNHEKRRAENARFLERQAKRRAKRSGRGTGSGGKSRRGGKDQDLARDDVHFEYLTCPFCGQKMRVPRGKGKIAVKCPSCGEKTIVNS